MAISFLSPFSINASTSSLNCFSVSAMMVLRTVIEIAQLAEEPTALNSNLLPVNAKGEVRLRSVLSSISSGILRCKSSFKMASSCSSNLVLTRVSTSANTFARYWPTKTEIIAGGASLAPKRWSLGSEAIDARIISALSWTALIMFTKKVRNIKLVFGVLPGASKFTPVSVAILQLLCLPLPLIPAKGFSCSSTTNWWRRATRVIISISRVLWSTAIFTSSKIGAHSNCEGATSLWRVRSGIPNLYDSCSKSRMKA